MIKVLIVDDSSLVCKILSDQLSAEKDIQVVGTAVDPYVARDKIVRFKPDVITLDLEMPRMDGLSFLARLMKYYPIPVIVVSSLAPENSENAIKALSLGAVDVVGKPGSRYSAPDIKIKLLASIRAAAAAKLNKFAFHEHPGDVKIDMPEQGLQHQSGLAETTHKIIAIGASTGGTGAIESVLRRCPPASPGMVIVQHMPEGFTAFYASRLKQVCPLDVREARDGDAVVPGVALIAPGNLHMVLQKSGASYNVRIKDGPMVFHQRPSVDVLFHSVAKAAGRNAVGVLLTGMGFDGAKGLLAMREAGARTICQDEATSVVFGMPKEAIKLGAADEVLPLGSIPQGIFSALAGGRQ